MISDISSNPESLKIRLSERNKRIEEYLRFLDEGPLGKEAKFKEFHTTLEKLIFAKEELEEAWDGTPIPSFILDKDLKILRCNQIAAQLFQKSFFELKGEVFPYLFWKDEIWQEEALVLSQAKEYSCFPAVLSRLPGSFHIISKPLEKEGVEKRVLYIIDLEALLLPSHFASTREVSNIQNIDEDRLLLALEGGKNGVWDFYLTEGKAYFSPQYARILGFDPDKFPNNFSHWETLVHWEDKEKIRSLIQDYINGTIESHDLELRMYSLTGKTVWVWSRGKVVKRDAMGYAERVVGTHLDITERKKAEIRTEAVLELNQRTLGLESEESIVLLGIRYAMQLTESEWGLVRIRKKREIEKEVGLYTCKDETSSVYLPLESPFKFPTSTGMLQLNFTLSDDADIELTLANKRTDFESTDHKEVQLIGSELCQVLLRKRTEGLLRTSEWNLQSIVECSPNGILILQDTKISFCNRSAEIFLEKKKSEIINEEISDILGIISGEDPYELIRKIADEDQTITGSLVEKKVVIANGRKKWLGFWAIEIIYNGQVGFLVYLNDLSKTKETEGQLLQSEKLATIGQLAAGVAHEINNPMAFIQSNLDTLKRYNKSFANVLKLIRASIFDGNSLGLNSEILNLWKQEDLDFLLEDTESILDESKDGSDRVIEIVKNIKSFAHSDKEDCLSNSNVNELVRSAVNLIFNKIKYESEIIYSLQEDLPFISCRPQELGQVLINLLANAGHAIEEKKEKGLFPEGIKERPGKIEISTNIKKAIFPNGSDAIEIAFKDNGIGISEDALSRIFDPFFTTKEIGVGTGLGLSISMDIIRKHQGLINVESVKCQGTTFHIYLPITERKDDK
ncbi:hypothetical protein LPTSP3_g09750 [Leptospira kobayashii]|uniref:histidine kinase n=1 Tax=Leptospira kobayashii TaxID=1917830 RepID=A0ABM7UH96_9LEPT|nr:ATP-binding protein [Leptospira kobayashii]BDA78045.1 hypothetical protein LPTSP3_g09750 [Leptospira kobayashii]